MTRQCRENQIPVSLKFRASLDAFAAGREANSESMRTLLLTSILLVLVPLALFKPWIGAVGWAWIGTMNPHKLTFGFLESAPLAAAVAGATLIGLLFTRERRPLPINGVTVTLLIFIAWMCLTTVFAIYPNESAEMWSKVMKVQLMIFATLMLLYKQEHLTAFIWAVALSLTFYGVKGGIYTIITGGSGRVWGPPGGWIEGNNELALALVMTIPMLNYLRGEASNRWVRHGLLAAMVLSALSVLGTHSRGALLAAVGMAAYLWRHSERKFGFGFVLVVVALALVAFMPAEWEDRMKTIGTYQADTSAMGRINAWWMAFNLARERLIGGGFEVITPELFAKYAPDPVDLHSSHSIYFQVLGEHGFFGLFLFLMLWFLTWRAAGGVIRRGKSMNLSSISKMGSMVQVSLFGYFVGGAFLGLAYFDLPYNLMVVALVAQRIIGERANTQSTSLGPAVGTRAIGIAQRGGGAG